MSLISRVRHPGWIRLALVLAAMLMATAAAAQEFRTDPNFDDKARMHRQWAQRSLKSPADYATNKARFDEFFLKYYFPAMTRHSPDDLAELGKLRYELFSQYLWKTSNEALQKDLTQMAFEPMLKIAANLVELRPKAVAADPPYHPAVRYNAILVVGMLDEKYAVDGGANARPPKPLPRATNVLTTIIDRATTSNQFPPPVILGALIGLERHARYRDALAPGAADAMTAALLKLVSHDKPIQEMDREAYAWIRLRAASALAQLGSVGQNNAVHDALIKLIADFKSLDDRCATAAVLAKLKYEGVKIDAPAAKEQLFKLARDLGAAEAKRAQEFEGLRIGGGGGFVSARAERFGPDDSSGAQDSFPRRHVLARFTDLRSGLRAVKPAVPDDVKKEIDAVLEAIKPAIDAAADEDIATLRLTEVILTTAEAIDEAAAPAEEPAAEEPAAAEPAAEEPAAAEPAAAADESSN